MTNDVGYKTRLRNPIWRDSPKWEYSHRSDGLLYSQVEDMQPVHYVLHALARSWVDPRWRLNHMRESKYFGSRKNFVVIFENPQEHGRIEDPREVWKAFPEEFLPMFDDQERQNHHYGINGYGLGGLRESVQKSIAAFDFFSSCQPLNFLDFPKNRLLL